MKYRVVLTNAAKRDLFQTIAWWGEHRSFEQAERWYAKIIPAIDTLAEQPDRCPVSPETDLLPTGVTASQMLWAAGPGKSGPPLKLPGSVNSGLGAQDRFSGAAHTGCANLCHPRFAISPRVAGDRQRGLFIESATEPEDS